MVVYSMIINNNNEMQYCRVNYYREALNIIKNITSKTNKNIKILVKKLTYKDGCLIDTIIKKDIK